MRVAARTPWGSAMSDTGTSPTAMTMSQFMEGRI
jgi:hypothetical protein